MSLVEKEIVALPENLGSFPVSVGVRVAFFYSRRCFT